jgi:hypothetical protein
VIVLSIFVIANNRSLARESERQQSYANDKNQSESNQSGTLESEGAQLESERQSTAIRATEIKPCLLIHRTKHVYDEARVFALWTNSSLNRCLDDVTSTNSQLLIDLVKV